MSVKNQRVTLQQIAEETGYAVNTVSKALRGGKDISEKTREVICDKAEEMGYVQNSAASMLRTGRSMLIAVCVVDITNPYWSIFCHRIEQLAYENGYMAIFMSTNADAERERYSINTAVQHGVDGVLIDPCVDCQENLEILKNVNTPFILLGDSLESIHEDCVCFNGFQIGYLAGKQLMKHSPRKILYMNIPEPYQLNQDRQFGFNHALEEAGFSKENVVFARTLPGQGVPVPIMQDIYEQHPDIDAICTCNDFSALQLLSTLRKMNKRVPEDIVIVSVNNIQSFIETGIRLTSVETSPVLCAENAFNLLLKRISGDRSDFPSRINLPVKLVKGETD